MWQQVGRRLWRERTRRSCCLFPSPCPFPCRLLFLLLLLRHPFLLSSPPSRHLEEGQRRCRCPQRRSGPPPLRRPFPWSLRRRQQQRRQQQKRRSRRAWRSLPRRRCPASGPAPSSSRRRAFRSPPCLLLLRRRLRGLQTRRGSLRVSLRRRPSPSWRRGRSRGSLLPGREAWFGFSGFRKRGKKQKRRRSFSLFAVRFCSLIPLYFQICRISRDC